jgi:CIC family chloride channel protein
VTERGLVWAGWLPHGEAFETLQASERLVLPILGGLAIGLLFQAVVVGSRQVGVVHVMTQLARFSGHLPWRNAVLQFVGGALSIVCGHSVGREGPVIHLGAASASLLGEWLRLPNNSIRMLVACGVAGSIAASFNTPIAGVVFAMEVVMLEYTIVGFAPVILAAVAATSLSRIVFGPDPAFAVPNFQLASLLELPWIVLLGLLVGCLAAAYVYGVRRLDEHTRGLPLWLRTTAAGALVGMCALIAPEVMGLGYDTVQLALLGEIGLAALLTIAVMKLVATIACGGLGLPGGMIGPMVVIGAAAGGALGILGGGFTTVASSPAGFYSALGIVAMMGAGLQAPLAALMAILELTANPNAILPGMVAVVTALLVARVVFRQDSLFVAILRGRGMEYRFDPVALALERTGVRAVMNRRFVLVDLEDPTPLAERLLTSPDWVVLVKGDRVLTVADASALAKKPGEGHANVQEQGLSSLEVGDVPDFVTVSRHDTLRSALALLEAEGSEVALVSGAGPARPGTILGVLTRQQIESSVRYRESPH